MNLLLNVLWVILGGFVTALQYLLAGLVLCLTVVGIPFGLQCFKLAGLSLWPFGYDIRDAPPGSGTPSVNLFANVVWVLVAGIWICISHLTIALGLAVTIIGIPFAIQHAKLAFLSLAPFGKEITEIR
ncbi:MAG: YccF domain-containing protein [Myxococcota bacterium]